MSHKIETVTTRHDPQRDRARITFRCTNPGCDLRGTVTAKPAALAAQLVADAKAANLTCRHAAPSTKEQP